MDVTQAGLTLHAKRTEISLTFMYTEPAIQYQFLHKKSFYISHNVFLCHLNLKYAKKNNNKNVPVYKDV